MLKIKNMYSVLDKKCKACYTIITTKVKQALHHIKGSEIMFVFFEAALPWIALGIAVAVVMVYSKNGKEKENEKQNT